MGCLAELPFAGQPGLVADGLAPAKKGGHHFLEERRVERRPRRYVGPLSLHDDVPLRRRWKKGWKKVSGPVLTPFPGHELPAGTAPRDGTADFSRRGSACQAETEA